MSKANKKSSARLAPTLPPNVRLPVHAEGNVAGHWRIIDDNRLPIATIWGVGAKARETAEEIANAINATT